MRYQFGKRLLARTVFASTSLALAISAIAADVSDPNHLTAAVVIETVNLDPLMGQAKGSDRNTYNLYVENLIYHAEDGSFRPMLAESWSTSLDNKSITFKLRPNVKFQDGTSFNAAAVKFNFDRVQDPNLHSRVRFMFDDLASTEFVDDLTVRVNLKEPSGSFMAMLAEEAGSIVSPTAVKSLGRDFGYFCPSPEI
jgi:peptide/nickel transport system substrate-binding protein